MTPHTKTDDNVLDAPIPNGTESDTRVAVQLAHLTGKIDQVIGDHERRLTKLENDRSGAGVKTAAIFSPIVAGLAFLVILADKIQWQ